AGVFSPDSKLFAFSTQGGEIGVVEASSGRVLHQWKVETLQDAPQLAFSADSAKLYSKLSSERVVRQWDVHTGKAAGFFGDKSDDQRGRFAGLVSCLALMPDGKTLAVGDSNALRFVDLTSGQDRPLPNGHSQAVAYLTYSPDAKHLVTRSGDLTMRVWDAVTGKQLKQLPVPATAMNFNATPDGRTVAIVDERGVLTLVDGDTGKQLANLGGEKTNVAPVIVFSPDGRILAVRRAGATHLELYDVPSGKERCRLGAEILGSGPAGQQTAGTFFFSV